MYDGGLVDVTGCRSYRTVRRSIRVLSQRQHPQPHISIPVRILHPTEGAKVDIILSSADPEGDC